MCEEFGIGRRTSSCYQAKECVGKKSEKTPNKACDQTP